MRYVLLFCGISDVQGAMAVRTRREADDVIALDKASGFRIPGEEIEVWSRTGATMKLVKRA